MPLPWPLSENFFEKRFYIVQATQTLLVDTRSLEGKYCGHFDMQWNLSLVHWDVDALSPRTREQPISTWQRSQIDRFRGRDFSNYFMLSCPLTLFRHVRHLIATNHCLVNWCVFIKTPQKMFRTINLIIKLIKPVNEAKRQNLHITHKVFPAKIFQTTETNLARSKTFLTFILKMLQYVVLFSNL